ncbi:MAG: single-stranded-DNA-specific exonuclease RecJ [Synechococcales cyanobacterium K44_A2020_017]|nr:single-stranded-DNA-specific exonuclease RecJ [Synechococcales cyanobacterium K32_A2020_035]MBF2096543.1 single-stranded-DNA-specific exonuclease RecJ [Synechococcales cyanobacterium K44_A2020_017]
MPGPSLHWQLQPASSVPDWFLKTVQDHVSSSGQFAAQLLWQRGIRTAETLRGFLNPDHYQPTSPSAFGVEIDWAIARIQQACDRQERVAIWGDFDADGVTATSVLWEGLSDFFPAPEQLRYVIPNRLKESHGLTCQGLDDLAQEGVTLVITCDTGSTNLAELDHAQTLGIDVIVTDHHTLPDTRPAVVALINPRSLPRDHPLAHLSGVAVAYKLVEALYQASPKVASRSLESLLDLVAIGLIADLVQLSGDCRYLAQRGIQRLQLQSGKTPTRPGVARLLELCKRSGDRPTDISYGLGPRINAISRVQGDARFCVELLTSGDSDRCRQLAEQTELANARRKSLQRDVVRDVRLRLAQVDLSTTYVIVLDDPQWSVGVLGLVAGQIAREYGRPTILLNSEVTTEHPMARGSARSLHQIDLYDLMQGQQHLLHRFGGHPFAAGLSLPVEYLPLFADAINRDYRQRYGSIEPVVTLDADLVVTVAQLGPDLFRELKLLEPCGIGNPAPLLLIQNCWFEKVSNQNIKDWRGRKVQYIKTQFELWDDSVPKGFPGVWWEHYRDEVPRDRCDALVELDFNAYHKHYEVRLVALRSQGKVMATTPPKDWILDWRGRSLQDIPTDPTYLVVEHCPTTWNDLYAWFRRAHHQGCALAIAYPQPSAQSPRLIWQELVGIGKYLSRTQQPVSRQQLLQKLGIRDRSLQVGIQALQTLGFTVTSSPEGLQMGYEAAIAEENHDLENHERAIALFLAALQEEQFRQRYFYQIPIDTIRSLAQQALMADA